MITGISGISDQQKSWLQWAPVCEHGLRHTVLYYRHWYKAIDSCIVQLVRRLNCRLVQLTFPEIVTPWNSFFTKRPVYQRSRNVTAGYKVTFMETNEKLNCHFTGIHCGKSRLLWSSSRHVPSCEKSNSRLTQVVVWENQKCCKNTGHKGMEVCFQSCFDFLKTFATLVKTSEAKKWGIF